MITVARSIPRRSNGSSNASSESTRVPSKSKIDDLGPVVARAVAVVHERARLDATPAK